MLKPVVFTESRKLPLAIGCFSIVLMVLVDISGIRLWCRIVLSVLFGCAALWALWRAAKPRWVVQMDDFILRHRDLSTKEIIEISISEILEASIQVSYIMGGGDEGGIGITKNLVLKTKEGCLTLALPIMNVNPKKIAQAINSNLTVSQTKDQF